MKRFFAIWLWAVVVAAAVRAEEPLGLEEKETTPKKEERAPKEEEGDLQLPAWEADELEELESGDYVPGSALLGELARQALESDEDDLIELSEAIRNLPEDGVAGEEMPTLSEDQLERLFRQTPAGLLNDPQELLTTREFHERKYFLSDRASKGGIGFYLYVFSGEQELPAGPVLQDFLASRLNPEDANALVFYFLGKPEKAQLAFSRRVRRAATEEERVAILEQAKEEALEKSEAISQLADFSTELSAGLDNLEKAILQDGGSLLNREVEITAASAGDDDSAFGWLTTLIENDIARRVLGGGGLLLLAALLAWAGRYFARRRKVYHFPDAEGAALLEAPHAAGVGAVLSFSSVAAPPSRQKKEVPDYLH